MKLNLKGLNQEEKSRAKTTAGQILVDSINEFLDKSDTPVSGGKFKKKKEDGTNSQLFEFGDMRASISFEEADTDHVEVGIFDSAPEVEKLKSFNHNKGDTLPKREFIAAPNKRFKEEIMKKVDASIDVIKAEADRRKEIEDQLIADVLTLDIDLG